MKQKKLTIILFAVVLLSCAHKRELTLSSEKELMDLQNLSFSQFVDESYFALLRTYPELVTELGLDRQLNMSGTELDSWDEDFLKERERLEEGILDLLTNYNPDNLSEGERITYMVYRAYLQDLVEAHQYSRHQYLLSYMITSVNVATEQFFTEIIPVNSESDAEKYITRLRAVERKMEEVDRQLQLQEEKGITLPATLIGPTLNRIRGVSRQKSDNSSFYTTLENKLEALDIDESKRTALLEEAEMACREQVLPAYGLLEQRLIKQQSTALKKTGVSHLPDGQAYYEHTLRHHTNSDRTAEEIHNMGFAELERIHDEMRDLFRKLGYDDSKDISELYDSLERDDKRLSGNDIVAEHRSLIDEAITWMDPYFSGFPAGKAYVKADSYGGYYIPPSFDGSRPGTFYASTGSVSYFTLPTLTFHETYPGHHYQIALAGGMDLPFFRRQAWFTGYLEGWALYAEYLMAETGYYDDDIPGRLGHLQAEAFRAARLVVDTGLHLYDWDINKAATFFADNTGFDRGFSQNQIYRYLVWPGQAASYYTGFMEFREILEREKKRLGSEFDYKKHHELALGGGPMPLTVLKEEIYKHD